jgi:Endomembrane protein 70
MSVTKRCPSGFCRLAGRWWTTIRLWLVVLLFCAPGVAPVLFSSLWRPLFPLQGRGRSPREYRLGDPVNVRFGPLFSPKTQLPSDYSGLPLCHAPAEIRPAPKPLWQAGQPKGDSQNDHNRTSRRFFDSPYPVSMLANSRCEPVCTISYNDPASVDSLKRHIDLDYRHQISVDGGLPGALAYLTTKWGPESRPLVTAKHWYFGGIRLGFAARPTEHSADKAYYVYNHFNILLWYHRVPEDSSSLSSSASHLPAYKRARHHVVGFAVEPLSVRYRPARGSDLADGESDNEVNYFNYSAFPSDPRPPRPEECPGMGRVTREQIREPQIVQLGERVTYTFDVTWEESNVTWSNRWDVYLQWGRSTPASTHALTVVNAVAMVLMCTGAVVVVGIQDAVRDVDTYRALQLGAETTSKGTSDGECDESDAERGLKSSPSTSTITSTSTGDASANLFRPAPTRPMLYSALVGTGIQLFATVMLTLVLAFFGITGQAWPGSLVGSALLLFVFTGALAGFCSGRLYGAFVCCHRDRVVSWGRCALLTAGLFPGVTFLWLAACSVARSAGGSADQHRRKDLLKLAAVLWLSVQVPLVFVGSRLAHALPPPQATKIPFRLFFHQQEQIRRRRRLEESLPCIAHVSIALLSAAAIFCALKADIVNPTSASVLTLFSAVGYCRRRFGKEDVFTVDVVMAAAMPFAVAYAECLFIYPSLWKGEYYDSFGFALGTLLAVAVLCAELAILLVRGLLRKGGTCGSHHWPAFFGSGSVSFYAFLFAAWWSWRLELAPTVATYVVYFGTAMWISFSVLLVFGSVGALTVLWFLRVSFSWIPSD